MPLASDISALYERFGSQIYSYLRRLTQNAELAQDLTQETFLRVMESFQSFRGEGEISNWLYRIATNLFRDYLRAHKGKEQDAWDDKDRPDMSEIPAGDPPVTQFLEREAVTQCVRDCIAALPPPYRSALLLYAVEGKTVEESATILGCSKEAVKVRLHRGRHLFKSLAAERCEVSVERRGGVTCLPKESRKEPLS